VFLFLMLVSPHNALNDTSAAICTSVNRCLGPRRGKGEEEAVGLIGSNSWAGRTEEIILFSSTSEFKLKPE